MNIWLIRPKMIPRPMDSYFKLCMSPPLALILIKQITPPQHNVTIIDYNFKVNLPNEKPDIVAVTSTVDVADEAIELAAKFKKMGAKTVVGGIHATSYPQYFFNHFDSVCIGPAELNWQDILKDAETDSLKKVYQSQKQLCAEDIPVLQVQSAEKRYLFNNVVTTSRGCNFKCPFCYNSASHQPLVNRNFDDVIREIKLLNTSHVLFVDDNFISNIEWTKSFLSKIKDMDLTWSCAVSCNIINYPDLLDEMANTGCQSLFIGLETINPQSLKNIKKGQNKIEEYEKLIKEIHQRKMMINASIMLGIDGDTVHSIDTTINWLIKNEVDTLTTHILTPYPGTKLYSDMEAQGRLLDAKISKYNTANVVFTPKNISPDNLYKSYLKVYRKFYSFKNIIKRMPQKNSKRKTEYLLFNFLYRKFGKPISFIAYKLNLLEFVGRLARRISYKIK